MSLLSLFLGIFTIVQLNCENLFDCRHDSLKQDEEYLPESPRRWNPSRYWQKLNNIGQEIIACGEGDDRWQLPDLVALCEVENDSVCRDLCRRSLLRKAGYEYVVTDSPDLRGIDVALLYSPLTFRLIDYRALRVVPLPGMRPTRDILYATGQLRSGDTLHVFVVHTPSQYDGRRITEPRRQLVAARVLSAVDSIRRVCREPKIVVTGDFNETAAGPVPLQMEAAGFYNVSRTATGSHGAKGTYKYQGRWEGIDHIFLSSQLAAALVETFVCDAPFLLEEDAKNGGMMPRRTFVGYRYNGGFSDHLPLVARMIFY